MRRGGPAEGTSGGHAFDVAIWGVINTRAAVTLRRVAQACLDDGLRTVLLWWEYDGPSGRTPADYPVPGLEFREVRVRKDLGPVRYPNTLTLPFLVRPLLRELEATRPRCIVTQLDHTFVDRAWHVAARRMGIPGVVLQEGMSNVPKRRLETWEERRAWEWRWVEQGWRRKWIRALPHPLLKASAPYLFADRAFVWGEAMKRHLVEAGRPAASITVTGSPLMDGLGRRGDLVDAARKTILYVHQPMHAPVETKRAHYEEILRVGALDLGCRVIFKLHPGCSYETRGVRALAAELSCPPHLVDVIDSGDAVPLLAEASVVVVATSTMAYHAAVAGVPLVVLDYYFDDIRFDVGDSGGALVVEKASELRGALERALFDDDTRRALHVGAGRLLEDHLLALDGRSARRVAAALGELAGRRAGSGPPTEGIPG